ncbi:hypothetical protein PVAP13_3KG297054 [Panicum virgatum]|uniref:Uncharacterized protein n=1 Tax=Panicum virgatum TaxID=38727 RepID=A0A8T0UUK8_PANVG|nr:hypothetical protein PVAP13_3KG297054 [Panicum virgatum]
MPAAMPWPPPRGGVRWHGGGRREERGGRWDELGAAEGGGGWRKEGAARHGGGGEEVEVPRSARAQRGGARGTGEGGRRSTGGESRGLLRRRYWRPPAAAAALVGGRERGERDEENVDIEGDKTQGLFCIYSCLLKDYGSKWHNLTSSGC